MRPFEARRGVKAEWKGDALVLLPCWAGHSLFLEEKSLLQHCSIIPLCPFPQPQPSWKLLVNRFHPQLFSEQSEIFKMCREAPQNVRINMSEVGAG